MSASSLVGSAVDAQPNGGTTPSSRMHAVTLDSLRVWRHHMLWSFLLRLDECSQTRSERARSHGSTEMPGRTAASQWRCMWDALQEVQAGGEKLRAWQWRFILSGGRPPVDQAFTSGLGDLLVTGHRDGRARLWDASAQVPELWTYTLYSTTWC